MEKPRHIVWDWNGTLRDDVQAAVNGMNALLRARSLPEVSVEVHRELFSFPVRNYYAALGFELEKEDWEQLSHDFITAFLSDKSARLFPDTVRVLERFRSVAVGMSVLSVSEKNVLDRALRHYGIRSFFENVRGISDHGASSKAGIAVDLFRSLGGVDGVWIVGDTTHDKEVADGVGCMCALVSRGYQSRRRLEACGCPVFGSTSEVADFFGIR